MFLDCPAYLDQDGAARCGLPAEIRCRFIMHSTDGPLESAMIRCPAGHWFNGPIEFLTQERADKHDPGTAARAPTARHDSLQGPHDGRDGGGLVARQAGAGRFAPEHRSCLLSGPARPPVDHRHAPAPQPHRGQSPGRSCHGGRRRTPTRRRVTADDRRGGQDPGFERCLVRYPPAASTRTARPPCHLRETDRGQPCSLVSDRRRSGRVGIASPATNALRASRQMRPSSPGGSVPRSSMSASPSHMASK
jgi:hypothetical protein